MSIPFTGSLRRSGGLISALGKHIKLLNLKAAKRIEISFDPFTNNAAATRNFVFHLSAPKVTDTNPKCIVKTHIVSDRSDPTIVVDLIPEVQEAAELSKIKFNAGNLSTLEILELFNKHVTDLAPPEEVVQVVKTKSAKRKK